MRIQIFSDIHVDVVGGFVPSLAAGTDVVVMAGDACEGASPAMAFLRAHIPPPTPIVFVLGNHEFYGRAVVEERAAAAEAARVHAITLLDDSVAEVGGVRFVGATLWTDYCLGGEALQAINMLTAEQRMNDYLRIRMSDTPLARFTPSAALAMHRSSRAFVWAALQRQTRRPTVVVTHHAPHQRSIHARFVNDPINSAFVSDQFAIIERFQPALWVHGHVHNSFDYALGATRVICNPRGYGEENPAFDPLLVVDL